MELIFWRHAEAEDEREGLPDLDRALTPRGLKQAAKVAAWLEPQLPEDTRILCSPALRCEQTVAPLGRKYEVREDLAPGAIAAALLDAAQWPVSKQPVLIVGHQPTIGETVAQLLRIEGGSVAVRKSAVWWLRSRERDGDEQTVVWAVQSPETLP
ncbi:histidine phosphatase family protein [Ramlibacter sp. XY19]|uniref:SixA phosphatase family protein n=1 Tax=Ramlibacter paludis TaxID=2908000 RepID=UPI0023DBC798|nr:histidine phosphatase family protein [Ramlibacter paludis]MCG2595006.1 histidine phosphatase family protein [Ramlibacter paludis]